MLRRAQSPQIAQGARWGSVVNEGRPPFGARREAALVRMQSRMRKRFGNLGAVAGRRGAYVVRATSPFTLGTGALSSLA